MLHKNLTLHRSPTWHQANLSPKRRGYSDSGPPIYNNFYKKTRISKHQNNCKSQRTFRYSKFHSPNINHGFSFSEPYVLVFLRALDERVLDLASDLVCLGAHGIGGAGVTVVWTRVTNGLAEGGWFVFNQPILNQGVSSILKDVQIVHLNAAFEKASSFSAFFSKLCFFLKKKGDQKR